LLKKLFSVLFYKPPTEGSKFKSYVESEPYEEGFAEHYRTRLLPRVKYYEKKRIKALSVARSRCLKSIPIIIVLLGITVLAILNIDSLGRGFSWVFYISVGMIISIIAFIFNSIDKYKTSIKGRIFPRILEFTGDFEYKQNYKAPFAQYKKYDILPPFDPPASFSEDYVKGTYNNVNIEFFEARLMRGAHYKGKKAVFNGVIAKISVNKKFSSKTVIRPDKGSFGDWVSGRKLPENQEVVRLEDPKFDKLFNVYSNDQIEARYLLTTTFMERLIEVEKAFGSKKIECSFYKQSLVMAIHLKKDWFEPGPITEIEDFQDDSKNLLADINSIFNICDTLQMDSEIRL
tara:strand:- start:1042 stop:2076 length:1035 start_codon:yes stop_codon:yes gene_type:complete